MSDIINKVAQSSLVTLDLEEYYTPGERVLLDIKDFLFQGLVLREKDLRDFIKSNDWSNYSGKLVAIDCSTDAIIPTWAYMLLASALQPYTKFISVGSLKSLEEKIFHEALQKINVEDYRNTKVVVKGCGKVEVPASAYVHITTKLKGVASSIMFGEPCSTVPIYKAK